MKTIKEKYKEIVSGWNDERTENVSKRCEEIADDYAIEFAEWIEEYENNTICKISKTEGKRLCNQAMEILNEKLEDGWS